MTVREFIEVLEKADKDLTIAFEWDGGFSSPVGPIRYEKYLVFDVSSYNSACE